MDEDNTIYTLYQSVVVASDEEVGSYSATAFSGSCKTLNPVSLILGACFGDDWVSRSCFLVLALIPRHYSGVPSTYHIIVLLVRTQPHDMA